LVHEIINMKFYTTRKLINTNGNTEKIFQSVNFREILPTEIFPWYIPRKLQWGKKLKQSKKKMMTCHFYQRNYPVGIFKRAPELFTFQLHY
jgi:hypothetical protein